jgi:hypothetical protein
VPSSVDFSSASSDPYRRKIIPYSSTFETLDAAEIAASGKVIFYSAKRERKLTSAKRGRRNKKAKLHQNA